MNTTLFSPRGRSGSGKSFLLSGILFVAAFPFLLYWGLNRFPPRILAALLLVPVLLRFLGSRIKGVLTRMDAAVIVLLLLLVAASSLLDSEPLLRLYPVFVSAAMLFAFAWSLSHPPTVIERFARLKDPSLSPRGIRYTRKVTQVWCGFFLLNGIVAALTAFALSREAWLFYNGFLSYLLIGALFAGEWLFRARFLRGEADG